MRTSSGEYWLVSLAETPDTTDRESDGLTRRTLSGAKWTYLSSVVTVLLQTLVTALLARLLAPEAFGLVALSGLVLRFGNYFSQMGVGRALIQRRVMDQEHVRAGFWLSTVIGLLFTVIFGLLIPPVAALAFHEPELSSVLVAMSFTFLISGTSATAQSLLRRELRFREVSIVEVSSYFIGFAVVGSVLAWQGFGVWSLVIAALTQVTVSALLFNVLARPDVRPIWKWAPHRDLLGFGSAVSLVTFMEFINSNLDTLLIGRLAGVSTLGVYSKALNLTGLPMQYLSTSLSKVLAPSFSKVQSEIPRMKRALLQVLLLFSAIGIPVALGMCGAAREIIHVMLGNQWFDAIPVLRVAPIAACAAMLSHFSGVVLEAMALLKAKLMIRLAQFLVFGGVLFALRPFGLFGFAIAFVASETFIHIAITMYVSRVLGIRAVEISGAYTPGLMGGVVALPVLLLESWIGGFFGLTAVITLAAQIVSGVLVLGLVTLRVNDARVAKALHTLLFTVDSEVTSGQVLRLFRRLYGIPASSIGGH